MWWSVERVHGDNWSDYGGRRKHNDQKGIAIVIIETKWENVREKDDRGETERGKNKQSAWNLFSSVSG